MIGGHEFPTPSQILDGKVRIPIQSEVDWGSYVRQLADAEGHWLSYAFKGFERVKKLKGDIHHFASIGTGSGIDAIGAMEILQPDRVTLTDVAPDFLGRAHENILHYQSHGGKQMPVVFGLGSLLEPLGSEKTDVIYTNLPNLPIPVEQKTRLMEDGMSAVYFDPDSVTGIPENFGKHLLSLQHAFLLQAIHHLEQDGLVVVNLGARMPLHTIYDVFTSTGYTPAINYFGLKLQNNPQGSVSQYAAHEIDDVTFSYYRYEQGRKQLEGKTIQCVEQIVQELEAFRITSQEALKRTTDGEQVGYIAILIIAKQQQSSFIL